MPTRSSRRMARSPRSAAGKEIDAEGATTIIDANGTTVAPGLIDSHVHPVAGDWTPRQNQIRLDRQLPARRRHHMISAGEVPYARPPARRRRPEGDGDFSRSARSGRCAPAA